MLTQTIADRFATIGAQQYMFSGDFQTEAQALDTLKKIRALGYDSVEMCGFLMALNPEKTVYPWPELIAEAGLSVCGLHESVEDLRARTDELIERARWLGAKRMVAAAATRVDFSDDEQVTGLMRDLNDIGRATRDAGLPLIYHNHNQELERAKGRRESALHRMLAEVDPALMGFELDVAHIQTAGASPEAWCRRAKGRLSLLHVCDKGPRHGAPGELMRPMDSLPLGEGNMEWEAILAAAAESGAEGIVLEAVCDWGDEGRFGAARVSREYLRGILK